MAIENLLNVGDPCPFPTAEGEATGAGTQCNHGVQDESLSGQRYWYLPFVPNGINYVNAQGRDVVSYNFTGCLMVAYSFGGSQRVAHVSTGKGQDCLGSWADVKAQSKNVFEFRPSDFIDTGGGAFGGCYGIITSDLKTYAVTVTRDSAGVKIAKVTMAHLLR
ncbi:MAG: hypothetical protein AAFU85_28845 [Planctomycetota bacterium]